MSDGTHCYHDALPGYDARNVYHDGCPVCEERAASGLAVFGRLDDENLRTLIDRATVIGQAGAYLPWQSHADRRVCELILRIVELRRQFERV